ncbi:MAG: prolipoprotein diacylglyceryl transferase [Sphaerochaetaceae bacterium]
MYLYVDYPSFISPYVIPGLSMRWYAVMYLVAFAVTYIVMGLERKKAMIDISDDDLLSLFTLGILFLLLGARLGSVFIYSDERLYYLLHPWMIFWPFENGRFVGLPGMSFHGGVIGLVVGVRIFCRGSRKRAMAEYLSDVSLMGKKRADKKPRSWGYGFFQITDALLLGVPLGYTFGRLGNFFNAELYGRVTDSSIGMLFPDAGRLSTSVEWVADMTSRLGIAFSAGDYVNLPRFPSQLIEALFEGVVTFLILWFLIRPLSARRPHGFISGWYLILYGVFRFFIEYLREPDANLGYVISLGGHDGPIEMFQSFWNFTMGQVLCFLMVICGVLIILLSGRSGRIGRSGRVGRSGRIGRSGRAGRSNSSSRAFGENDDYGGEYDDKR